MTQTFELRTPPAQEPLKTGPKPRGTDVRGVTVHCTAQEREQLRVLMDAYGFKCRSKFIRALVYRAYTQLGVGRVGVTPDKEEQQHAS